MERMNRKKALTLYGENGFTLIEMIIVIILLGVMTAWMGGALVMPIQAFLFARNASETSQKSQLALARINRELTNVASIGAATADGITYTDNTGASYVLVKSASLITLAQTAPTVISAKTLINGVATDYGGSAFLAYKKADGSNWTVGSDAISQLGIIQVVLKLTGFGGTDTFIYQTTVTPRYNTVPTTPRMS